MGLGAGQKLAMLLLASVMLSGCGTLLGGGGPVDTFDLSGASIARRDHAHHHLQLLIPEPAALKMFDGQNIVIRSGPSSIAYLKGAQWGDRLPKIVQNKLLQSFEDTGRVGGVGTPGQGLAIDDQVVTEIRDFSIDATTNAAVVEVSVKLLNDRNGAVRASKVFQGTAPVPGTANADYVQALQTAFGQVSADIVSWTLAKL